MQTILFLALIILFVGSSVYCHELAKQKRKNVNFWTIIGLIFGPLAIPFLLITQ